MATFDELRTDLREEILVEEDTGFYSASGLLDFLVDASIEVAAAGAFPLTTSASNLSSGSGTLSAPSDILRAEVRGVTAGGFDLSPSTQGEVKLYKGIDGEPRYFYFNPTRGGSIEVGPKAGSTTEVVVEYVKDLTGESYSASDTPWDGVLPQFHDVVKYYAGVKAFEQGFEYGQSESAKAEYWMQRFQRRLQAMAAFLGDESVLSLAPRQREAQGG